MKAIAVVVTVLAIAAFAFVQSLFDTQYAPGYTESSFKRIKLGDTEERVKSLIGNPLVVRDSRPYVTWIYSADKQPDFAEDGIASGTYTEVRFETGAVTSISGPRQLSRNCFAFGDGQGFLTLSQEQIRGLNGRSPEEIRQRFGPPIAIYEYKAHKLLWYSRSPSGSNYRLRMLGLDGGGKVVHIRSSIYWD